MGPDREAGAISDFLRGNPNNRDYRSLLAEREALPDYYMNNDARIAKLDEQGLEAMWLFPTLGVLYEELLKHDTDAVVTLFRAFNRWVRTTGAATTKTASSHRRTSRSATWTSRARTRVGARTGCPHGGLRPAAVHTRHEGVVSPANTMFDPFWARVNEAGITVVIHAGDSGYTTHGYVRDGFSSFGGAFSPNIKHFNIERAAYDFLITLAYERLFERFPNVRVASIENGAEFLPDLFRKLRQSRDRLRNANYYKEDPGLLFREHVWINPFWEDDVNEVVDMMGPDRVIFGSDWPHIEGMPEPLDYVDELANFSAEDQLKILRDNTRSLNERRPL